jgi:ketosteroid isomerase-like protein
MVKTPAFLAVPALLLMIACSPSSPPAATDTGAAAASAAKTTSTNADADKDAVGKAHDVLEGSYHNSDCKAMVSNAASDAVIEPPNTASAKGVDGISAWCTPMFTQMKTKALDVSNKSVDVSGDIAVDRGDYDWILTPAKGGKDVRAKGRYTTIWHRQTDGSWKWTSLIWNSSEPMPKA